VNLSAWKRQQFQEILQRFAKELWELTEDSHNKGARWEEEFASMSESRGLFVCSSKSRADLLVNGKQVQCKNIDADEEGWIDISNRMPVKSNGGFRGYLASEVDVLALRHRGDVYLIPAEYITNSDGAITRYVRINSILKFVDAWAVFDFDYVAPAVAKQARLFEE